MSMSCRQSIYNSGSPNDVLIGKDKRHNKHLTEAAPGFICRENNMNKHAVWDATKKKVVIPPRLSPLLL